MTGNYDCFTLPHFSENLKGIPLRTNFEARKEICKGKSPFEKNYIKKQKGSRINGQKTSEK